MATNPVVAGFDEARAAKAQQRGAYDMLQRKFLADQYANVAAQPLPDIKTDPEGYQKALDTRAKALEAQQKLYTPEHHANLFDHLHGLITGKIQGQQPSSASAPQVPGQTPTADSSGVHPFQPLPADSPVHHASKLISELQQHLKAGAHPIAPKPAPDYKMLAAASTPEERQAAIADAAEKTKHEYKMEEVAAKPKPRDTVQKAEWDAEARKMGLKGYDDPDMTSEQAETIAKNLKSATTAQTWKSVVDGDMIYAVDAHDPTKKTAIGKKSEVTETHYDAIVQQANGDLVKVPMVRYSRKGSGEKIAEIPSAEPTPPESSAAPQAPSVVATPKSKLDHPSHAKMAAKAAKGPVPANAPKPPNVVGHKDTEPENAAKKLVDTAQASYLDVQKAGGNGGKSLDPVGSQGVVLSWLRGRVNRVTATEIAQVRNLGGIFQKFDGNVSSLIRGTMTPQQYQWFLRSAKDNYENAQTVASKYSSPTRANAPQVPDSTGAPKTAEDYLGGR
jgi:hypothetical protein